MTNPKSVTWMSSFKFLLHIFNIHQGPYDMHHNVTTVLKATLYTDSLKTFIIKCL